MKKEKSRATSKIAGAALAVLLVGGCGAAPEQDRQADPTATATGTEAGPEADISAGEGETVYLYARQAFSPSLDRWTVDEQMEELTYTRYDCLGGVGAEGLATLEPRDQENVWEATWVGSNPMRASSSAYIRLEIDEHTLGARHSTRDIATSRHESVLADYSEMCVEAGEGVARFVLP